MSGPFDYAQEDKAIAKWLEEECYVKCEACGEEVLYSEARWDATFDEDGEFVDASPYCASCYLEAVK